MANSITVSTVLDSPNLAVLQLYVKGDGSGEMTKQVIFDADTLTGNGAANNIWRILGCCNGFTSHIAYDQTTESVAAVLPQDRPFDFQTNPTWNQHPVLTNPAGSGTTGDITITTVGLGSGDEGFVNIVVQKKNLQNTA